MAYGLLAVPHPMYKFVLLVFCTLFFASLYAAVQIIPILSLPDLAGWRPHSFSSTTQYRLLEQDGGYALHARSDNAASAMIKLVDIDLLQTPYLHWSWRIAEPLHGLDETTKTGDDYVARVYVIVDGGIAFWKTWAISYVWAGTMPRGSSWPNAFSEHSMMVAIESGSNSAGGWVREHRNVLEDLRGLHGIAATRVNAVAIMTDTDNSHARAEAWYGDIYFSPE